MKDINKHILAQAHGACRLNPDEQKKFLETFSERVIATCSLEMANSTQLSENFPKILQIIMEDYQPIFIKLSPNLETKAQVAYMKIAQDLGCQTTIVSADCQHSPFGLVIHTDHALNLENTDLLTEFSEILTTNQPDSKKKMGFWGKFFH